MAVEVEGLVHEYEGERAIDGVDLRIRDGEFVLLAGRNGSGKTTLVRHFNALLEPDEGVVRVDGRVAHENPLYARKRVGMVFQDASSQIVAETVEDDVAFGPENLGLERDEIRERVDESLELLDAAGLADRSPHTLSGGETKRVAIAGVLAMRPDVVVLDEPLAGLDYEGTESLLGTLGSLNSRGVTVVVTTHDVEYLAGLGDRLVVLDSGRVAEDGDVMEVLASGTEEYGVREPYAVRLAREAGIELETTRVEEVLDAVRQVHEG